MKRLNERGRGHALLGRLGQPFGEGSGAAKFGDTKCVVRAMLVDEEVDVGVVEFDGASKEGEAKLEAVDGPACCVDGVKGGAELAFCFQRATPLQKLREACLAPPTPSRILSTIRNAFSLAFSGLGGMVPFI